MAENILVFCAHPDDEILGPGATIAKYASQGKNVQVVVFSYGEGSHPWLQKETTIEMRKKESIKAGQTVGYKKTYFLNLQEMKFREGFEKKNLKKKIRKIIKENEPTKIFVHSYDDPHPDHKQVNTLVLKLLREINYNGEVYSFEVWNPFNIRGRDRPRLYVDVSKTFELKKKAISFFKSQKLSIYQLYPFMIIKAILNGFVIRKKYAESFYRIY